MEIFGLLERTAPLSIQREATKLVPNVVTVNNSHRYPHLAFQSEKLRNCEVRIPIQNAASATVQQPAKKLAYKSKTTKHMKKKTNDSMLMKY